MNIQKLFFLTLISACAAHGAFGMFNKKTTVNTQETHVKAQAWATKFAAKTAAISTEATQRSSALPAALQRYMAKFSFYLQPTWRNKFYLMGGSYSLPVCKKPYYIDHLAGYGSQVVIHSTATSRDNIVELWDMVHGTSSMIIKEKTEDEDLVAGRIASIALSKNYIVFFTVTQGFTIEGGNIYQPYLGALKLYDKRTGKQVALIKMQEFDLGETRDFKHIHISNIAISPEENFITCMQDHRILLTFQRQDDGSWQEIWQKQPQMPDNVMLKDISYSPDNRWVISFCNQNTINLWDVQTGKLHRTLTSSNTLWPALNYQQLNALANCAVSADGTTIAASPYGCKKPIVFDTATGQEIQLEGHYRCKQEDKGHVDWVHFETENNIVSQHRDRCQRIWDTQTGQLLDTLVGNEKHFGELWLNGVCEAENMHYIISEKYDGLCENRTIVVQLSIGTINKLLQQFSLEQFTLVNDLMLARDKQTAKDQTKPLALPQEQLELFGTLPQFVQTALRLNLNLAIPGIEQLPAGSDSKSQGEVKKIAEEHKSLSAASTARLLAATQDVASCVGWKESKRS